MVSAPPSALKSMRLDVVEVHRDVGDVAGEEHAAAVGRDVDVLGDVGAVEQHRVEAGLALDGVVVVARVPDEGVVAGAHQGGVVAVAAVDQVVALAADEDVVAEAAVHRELDRRRPRGCVALMTSSPPRPLSVSRSLAAPVKKMFDVGLQAEHADAAGVAGDAEHVGAVGAVDGDRVGRAVAAAVRAAQVEVDLRRRRCR